MAELASASKQEADKSRTNAASPGRVDRQADADASAMNSCPPAPSLAPWQLLRMQRSAGNHAVAGLISRQYQRTAVLAPPVTEPPRPAQPEVQPTAQESRVAAAPTVQRDAVVQRSFGDSVLETVSGWAKEIPGYHLMTLILGRDPISGATVERNAMNVAHGILSIVPGGNKTFENLQQSGALERFFDWVSGEFGKLGLTFESIKQLFKQAWDALSVTDLLEPSDAWNKVKGIFGPPLGRIKDFAIAAGKKVLEFILEGVLKLAGPLGEQVMALLKKGGDVFNKIVEDPISFLGNLLKAVKGGFEGFMDHIAEHLKSGLMGWLFGALAGAGLTLPKTFDLKGILSLVLQVLGLTYQNLRGKLVKALGEKTVGYIETAVSFVKTLVTEGLAGAWKMIVEWVGSLKDMVLGAIQDWVVTSIVKAAVTKLVTMFNPVGAIVQGIITIYNTISFFIERAQQIGAVVGSIFDSVGRIAAGDVGGAAQFVEQTMAKAVPVMIGFLASLIGLGGIGNTIRGIIQKIQTPIEKALDKLVGFVAGKAKALVGNVKGLVDKGIGKVKGAFGSKDQKEQASTADSPNSTAVKESALAEVESRTRGKHLTSVAGFHGVLGGILAKYKPQGLKSLSAHVAAEDTLAISVTAVASPADQRTIAWEEVFASADADKVKPFFVEQGFQTNAALTVGGAMVGTVVQNDKAGHAEVNLVGSFWDAGLDSARKKSSEGKPVSFVIAINRAPCPACASMLASKIATVDPDLKKRVRFVLAPTGVYEPLEPITPEERQADEQRYSELAKKWGAPAYAIISKVRFREQDVTKWSDLKRLTAAGWDLRALLARPQPTSAGIVLAEAAHKLAVEFDKANK